MKKQLTNFHIPWAAGQLVLAAILLCLFVRVQAQEQPFQNIYGGSIYNSGFGDVIDLSGNGRTLVIGDWEADGNNGSYHNEAGRVTPYNLTGATHSPMGTSILAPPHTYRFGYSVSVSGAGNRMAVGAPHSGEKERVNGGLRETRYGKTFVYEWDPMVEQWNRMDFANGESLDGDVKGGNLGYSVSLSAGGDYLAVGVPHASNLNGDALAGMVKIYSWDLSTSEWKLLQGGIIYGNAANERFGGMVSISSSGTRLAICSIPRRDILTGLTSRVYEYDNGNWEQMGNAFDNGMQGTIKMCSSGDYIAVTYSSNIARIFQWVGNSWQQVGSDLPGAFYSADLSGDGLQLVLTDQLRTYAYRFNGTQWDRVGTYMTGTAPALSDLDNLYMAVGGNYNFNYNTNQRVVHVYIPDSVYSSQTLYVTDMGTGTVNTVISTDAGSTSSVLANIPSASGVVRESETTLLVASQSTGSLIRVNINSGATDIVASGFDRPMGVELYGSDSVAVVEFGGHRVSILHRINGGMGAPITDLADPADVVWDTDTTAIVTSHTKGQCFLRRFDMRTRQRIGVVAFDFQFAWGMYIDDNRMLYVAEMRKQSSDNGRILSVDLNTSNYPQTNLYTIPGSGCSDILWINDNLQFVVGNADGNLYKIENGVRSVALSTFTNPTFITQ